MTLRCYGSIFEIRPVGDMNEIIKASEQRRKKIASRKIRKEKGLAAPALLKFGV